MNSRQILWICAVSALLQSCAQHFNYVKSDNAITILGDSLTTHIEIINESIIHIKKELPSNPARQVPDLVTILEPQKVQWKVSEADGSLIIETSKLKATINHEGEITYQSADGKMLLSENQQSTFINPDTAAYYQVSQAFKAGDEALYGLGQFQSGVMNWKNVPVRLDQFNQEIAVPVLISTNQYGLYWNNYSITDFNLPKNEIELNEVVDEKLVIRKSTFTPSKSGFYNMFVLSETPFIPNAKTIKTNRRLGKVLLTLNSDTVIHYNTMWFPDSFTGEIELEAGKTYEVELTNTGEQTKARLMYNEPDYNKTVFTSQRGTSIDYYFIHGDNPVQVLAEYSKLTGKAPMFEKKSYGFWQCRENADPTQEYLLSVAKAYRERSIPVDNIVQDWAYWPNGTKGPEWDRSRFPNPQQMVQELTDMNYNLLVSVWPTVSNKPLLSKYGLSEEDKLKPTNFINFFDFSTHDKYYQMLSDSMFHIGVKSIWLDGSEPIDHPDPLQETPFGQYRDVSNTYAMLVSKAMYEGYRKEFPNQRVFNFTRSAFAGQQRYGSCMWSGDVDGSWEQFAEQIPAGTNFTMTGIPYWTTDIGGFFRGKPGENKDYLDQYTNPEFRELLTRWFQYGTFTPLFRIHGFKTETEIWKFGEEFEATARKFIDLRYHLMPYIYSEAWEVTKNAKVLMSPLAYYFPDDKNTWDNKYQFMFGKSIMACPVTTYKARELEVYLPEGNWYDYWTSEKLTGSQKIKAPAPLNSMPLYVREGSIIPTGPKVQYATQETDEPVLLNIYPGKDASYTLFLDDNVSYDYEKGIYSEINISYNEANKSITLEKGNGNYIDFSENSEKFIIKVIGQGETHELEFKGDTVSKQL